ncbi:Uncharacterised protein [Bordetella pertussis]|nr:Uncharacterised protein [Bordetella pertussis]
MYMAPLPALQTAQPASRNSPAAAFSCASSQRLRSSPQA